MKELVTRILVVDDDPIVAASLGSLIEEAGHPVQLAESGAQALEILRDETNDPAPRDHTMTGVVVTDVRMPDMDGLELIDALHREFPSIVPIAVTGYGTIEQAVSAIRRGAMDYLTKPIVDEELFIAVEKAVQKHRLEAENVNLRHQLGQRYGLDNIVGTDERMRAIYDVIQAVAPSRTTVLMCGESGTGKSLIAGAIHRNSPRADGPYVEISCGSIPETLLESELFGHVKGAFTDAHTNKPGRFLAADGGTLFLDEINSASPAMQLKLLRVIQERTFEPIGSNEKIEVDVRIVLASNEPLEELVAAGRFRQDLYYRINVVSIQLPPLRERVRDVMILAEHFLETKSREIGRQVLGFTDDAIDALKHYAYPGNVRELENIIERAVVLTRDVRIGVEDLPAHVITNSTGHLLTGRIGGLSQGLWTPEDYSPMPLREALEEPEKQIILAALQANNWNRQQTADDLDINRTTLYKKIKQYELEQFGQAG